MGTGDVAPLGQRLPSDSRGSSLHPHTTLTVLTSPFKVTAGKVHDWFTAPGSSVEPGPVIQESQHQSGSLDVHIATLRVHYWRKTHERLRKWNVWGSSKPKEISTSVQKSCRITLKDILRLLQSRDGGKAHPNLPTVQVFFPSSWHRMTWCGNGQLSNTKQASFL